MIGVAQHLGCEHVVELENGSGPAEFRGTFRIDDGQVSFTRLGCGVALVELDGRIPETAAEWLIPRLDDLVATGAPSLFFDTRGIGRFEFGFRNAMMAWMVRNRSRIRAAHVLTQRPAARIALAVANKALDGWIQAHPELVSFLAARDHALSGPSG